MKTAEIHQDTFFKVAEHVWGIKDIFVNVFLVANPDNSWTLVDAGLKTTFPKIKKAAAELFGENVPPTAVILTHGHFDHVGSLKAILEEWHVPVYAHLLEMPYLTGRSAYPPADPSVGGGMMAWMSGLYPNDPIDLVDAAKSLPLSGEIPFMPGWKYFHTPGHAPGHISLWRENDKVLIAGDAFVTTKQESLLHVITQRKVVSGPPKYFTCDWYQAEKSVNTLADLSPEVVATGHGKPMSKAEMGQQLMELAYNFADRAVPSQGRYVAEPAVTNRSGVVSLPESKSGLKVALAVVSSIAIITAGLYFAQSRRNFRLSGW
ncbi:MBL fold metallo-hydrolase [Dyadobacter sandarakinus]|uniref:MBL fold metallo-hydrolase n=1 Tax=Dyadobacter sandarakinus TaxID=2747268 RepID=A0ABX7I2X8_9BACT|nr:MBL fold metallo-hydrolase [Dyadobacter sandarakinus]QRR00305.1 MBL fold metallo-hydrolase [Dyadobacter sandarakinus]